MENFQLLEDENGLLQCGKCLYWDVVQKGRNNKSAKSKHVNVNI